ncbi:hypothetical protein MPSEU_000527200 [Mayamaea pseudoterrestris]|nr:hypothetical protein MPSEU_000527200 [Mayamaea pseudoterrestris]
MRWLLTFRKCSSRLIVSWCLLLLACAAYVRLRHGAEHWIHRRQLKETLRNSTSRTDRLHGIRKLKLLYIVTSIHEFDDGRRETQLGYDRFAETLIPVLRESTRSMNDLYAVDLCLITHYSLSAKRLDQVRRVLPPSVGFQFWDDATPLGYASDTNLTHLRPITRALARQHRYVIKDKIRQYELFVNFEDDMIVKADHVQHYLQLTQDWYMMRQVAPDTTVSAATNSNATNTKDMQNVFYGPMSKIQLERLVPGFIRVEAVLNHYHPHSRSKQPQIPLDYTWNDRRRSTLGRINASVCCHVSPESVNVHIPLAPTAEQLYFWETSIEALGVRNLPNDQWALLLGGNSDQYYADPNFVIGDYWTGRDGYFTVRPDKKTSLYMSNQGGWMATRRQIVDWHRRWCRGGFLPPFTKPHHTNDGLNSKTVEYWSGGIQIAGVLGCNLQRVVMLEVDAFSKHLLYHSSNNKQKVENVQYRFSSRNVQEVWGLLNTIRKKADKARQAEVDHG